MMKLLRAGRLVSTVFGLLGDDENDMTAALGYALSVSPELLSAFVVAVSGRRIPSETLQRARIDLQLSRLGEGRTDIEVLVDSAFYGIVEAKRDASLPTARQLALYAPILARSGATTRRLITLSHVTKEFAATHTPTELSGGSEVAHVSWREVLDMSQVALAAENLKTRHLLREFIIYLEEIVGIQRVYSNMVFVVSLGAGTPAGWSLSWRDIVRKRERYFYPVGKGWPDPPNYIAFRFDGRLQSVHHVRGHEVVDRPRRVFPEASEETWSPPHYVLRLGPPIVPAHPVPNGPKVLRSGHSWCMLDTLLTASTITEAVRETKRREGSIEK